MKYFLIIFFTAFSHYNGYTQAIISKPAIKKTILDFGAIPNDGKDDTWAFIKAGKYFSNLWNAEGIPLPKGRININYTTHSGKLEIPSGEYNVGKQIAIPANGLSTTYGAVFGFPQAVATLTYPAGNAFKAGLEIINLEKIDGLSIIGTGKTTPRIKYNNGLVIGYFNAKAEPMFFPASAYEGKYGVSVGSFISATNSKNISVENLSVDGNNNPDFSGGKTHYNGGWTLDLIQMGASGLYFLDSKNISLKNLDIHHMTLDGIIFQDFYKDSIAFPKQALSNLFITDCKFDYNRRQGFSWVGGRKVTVRNSSFSHTGTTVSGLAKGNPGAGLDIEPESDGTNLLYCIDGSFINCEFINNRGCALVNDVTAYRSRNMEFSNCIFHDVDGYSVWVKGKSFRFINSKIWGGFVFGNNGEVPGEETRFFNCDFADEELPYRKGVHNAGYALVESWQVSRKLYFKNCSFRTLHDKQRLIAIYTPSLAEQDFTLFDNCNFTTAKGGADNVLFGTIFDGITSFLNKGKDLETFLINGMIVRGSNDTRKPNSFNVDGNILLHPANSHGPGMKQFILGRSSKGNNNLGYLKFRIGPQAGFYSYWDQRLDIGKNSSLTSLGQLTMLSGTINLEGKLILEKGSHTAFIHPIQFNAPAGNPAELIYYNSSIMGIGPAWKTRLAGLGNESELSRMKMAKTIKLRKL